MPDDTDVILPSLSFADASSFLREVKPPFYENYDFVIVDDYSSNDPCFDGRGNLVRVSLGLLGVLMAALML